jgi:hypothetical protein
MGRELVYTGFMSLDGVVDSNGFTELVYDVVR